VTRKQNIGWNDVLNLRVVRHLGKLVAQRWQLGITFISGEGTKITSDASRVYTRERRLCGLVRAQAADRCRDALVTVVEALRSSALHSTIVNCHAGLREIAAPILVDGEYQGCVLAGAYLPTNGAVAGVQLPVCGDDVAQALATVPRLPASDEEYLRQLMELLAEEIAIFPGEVAASDRRHAAGRATRYVYSEIIGLSRPVMEMYHLLDKVIDSDSTVLIQGENGTGKELIAKAIHFNSWRKDRRFVVQNCSAFNDNLLDSELFGHKKGSFTGAISDKLGLFEVADGSTFFLDEIGDMSPSLQVKLLRVLQEGTFIPVGDTQVRKVDVRIIAATNRELKKMVERGEFREDLYYRINVINIHAPPLRERRDDVPLLVDHFLLKQARGDRLRLKKLSRACQNALLEYSWPGNIRELENEIERLVVLAGEEKLLIGEDLLSARIRTPASTLSASAGATTEPNCLPDAVQELERNMIYEVLKRNHWNKTRAAQELHISRRNLIRKVNKYNLDQRRAR
jgi:two-component system, NtrC family, response regulator HupR/HoxA